MWPHALEAFHRQLRDLGWTEGQDLIIEYRWAEGQFDRLPALTEELVQLKVVIPKGANPGDPPVQQATEFDLVINPGLRRRSASRFRRY